MTGIDHLAIWKRAVPLQQAYIRFAPKELAARWDDLKRETSGHAILERMDAIVRTDDFQALDIGERFASMSSALGPMDELNRLTGELQARCVRLIRSGDILAFAYVAPRALTDMPVPVPDDLWQQPVNWGNGTVSAHGLRMESVRLVLAQWIPTIMANHNAKQVSAITPKPAPRGRPTKRPDIIAAFQQLVAAGRIQAGMKLSDCYPLVRALVKESVGGTDDGMNAKTLHAILKPEFDKLR